MRPAPVKRGIGKKATTSDHDVVCVIRQGNVYPEADMNTFSRKEPPRVMPSLFLKKLDRTDSECLEEAGWSVPARDSTAQAWIYLRAAPAYLSVTAPGLGDPGPGHDIAEPSKLTREGRGRLDLPRKPETSR